MQCSRLIAGAMNWGVWGAQFSTTEYLTMINHCLSIGITSFDHADIYGHYTTEEDFGRALKEQPALREQMQLITKCGIRMPSSNRPNHTIKSYDTSRTHILQSVENSLRVLHTDRLDLLLLHRPDPLLNPDEVAEAFTQLQQSGKVLAFGVSNFSPAQTELLRSRFPIQYNQVEASILHLDPFTDGSFDYCITHNIEVMAWSPLGGGNLFAAEDDRALRIKAAASFLAKEHQCMPDQVLLAWLMQHPAHLLPVLGTTKAERIKSAMAASQIQLTREQWFMLWRASTGQEVA
jgi:predicted oxidoreductase